MIEKLIAHIAAQHRQRCTIKGCNKEFKMKAQLIKHAAQAHGVQIRSGSPRPVMKTRAAFFLCTNPYTKTVRTVCSDVYRPKAAAKNPFLPINTTAIKTACKSKSLFSKRYGSSFLAEAFRYMYKPYTLPLFQSSIGWESSQLLTYYYSLWQMSQEPKAEIFLPKSLLLKRGLIW